jgi:Protein of unknown function (DUF4031)
MIYIDSPGKIDENHPTAPRCFKGRMHSHLMADTEQELREYARKLGLSMSWIQHPGNPVYVHFDLTGRFLERALKDAVNGVIRQITDREMALLLRARREQLANSQNQNQAAQ